MKTRAEAAAKLMEAARRLADLARQPVVRATQHMAVHRARRALDDYEDAAGRDRKKERA